MSWENKSPIAGFGKCIADSWRDALRNQKSSLKRFKLRKDETSINLYDSDTDSYGRIIIKEKDRDKFLELLKKYRDDNKEDYNDLGFERYLKGKINFHWFPRCHEEIRF